jgi:hypothetical protein
VYKPERLLFITGQQPFIFIYKNAYFGAPGPLLLYGKHFACSFIRNPLLPLLHLN